MAASRRYALILAGGRGTRFWPLSRTHLPKQLLKLAGGATLLRQTFERLRPSIPPGQFWVLTNGRLRGEIIRQLPEVPKHQILAEPAARNTAPCIGLAARIIHQQDPSAILGVFPADHHIARPAQYRRLLRPAFQSASQGKLVALGIQPRWPEVGYGYLEFPPGVRPGPVTVAVLRFREKPDLGTAREFVAAGRFYWNAGMFFWRADVFLEALRRYLPRTAALLDSLPPFGSRKFASALAEVYPRCESVSVDYAVMEKADNVCGVPAEEIGWSDLGSWNALYELLPKDAQQNVARALLVAQNSAGNYVESDKLVALLGVENLVVVETADALLVADRSRASQVGELVKLLEKRGRKDLV